MTEYPLQPFAVEGGVEKPLEAFQVLGGVEYPLSMFQAVGGTEPPPPPPPPTTDVLLGAYMGSHSENPDTRYLSAFGVYPQLMSQYYLQDNASGGSLNVAETQARADRGTIPVITVRAHAGGGAMPWTYAQIISGAADSWINKWIGWLNQVNTPRIIWTFEHEFEVKENQAREALRLGTTSPTFPVTNIPTPADYIAAFNRFAGMVRDACPHVDIAYWYGYFDTAAIDQIGQGIIRPDVIMPDPYVFRRTTSAPDSTFENMVTGKITDFLFSRPWYDDQPVIFGEFAKDKGFGDLSCANFYANLRPRMQALGISGGLLFNRNKSGDILAVIDDGSMPLSQQAYTDSVQAT